MGFVSAVKVPRELVTELARVTTLAQQAWARAREIGDWTLFSPRLAEVLDRCGLPRGVFNMVQGHGERTEDQHAAEQAGHRQRFGDRRRPQISLGGHRVDSEDREHRGGGEHPGSSVRRHDRFQHRSRSGESDEIPVSPYGAVDDERVVHGGEQAVGESHLLGAVHLGFDDVDAAAA